MNSGYYREIAKKNCTKYFVGLLLVVLIQWAILNIIGLPDSINAPIAFSKLIKGEAYEPSVMLELLMTISSIVAFLVSAGFEMSWAKINQKVYRGYYINASDSFSGFSAYGTALVTFIVKFIFIYGIPLLIGILAEILIIVICSSLTLIIVLEFLLGIIISVLLEINSLKYANTTYLVNERGLSPYAALKRSKEIMKMHKMDLFLLRLSYIGWDLLCIVTLGILSLWIVPRKQQAQYLFYKDLVPDPKKPAEDLTKATTID